MTPDEAVLMDLLLERGYTREQAARALVALSLPEPDAHVTAEYRLIEEYADDMSNSDAAWLQVVAERRGYLSKPT